MNDKDYYRRQYIEYAYNVLGLKTYEELNSYIRFIERVEAETDTVAEKEEAIRKNDPRRGAKIGEKLGIL